MHQTRQSWDSPSASRRMRESTELRLRMSMECRSTPSVCTSQVSQAPYTPNMLRLSSVSGGRHGLQSDAYAEEKTSKESCCGKSSISRTKIKKYFEILINRILHRIKKYFFIVKLFISYRVSRVCCDLKGSVL